MVFDYWYSNQLRLVIGAGGPWEFNLIRVMRSRQTHYLILLGAIPACFNAAVGFDYFTKITFEKNFFQKDSSRVTWNNNSNQMIWNFD